MIIKQKKKKKEKQMKKENLSYVMRKKIGAFVWKKNYRIHSIKRPGPGRLLHFLILRVGANSRWGIIRGWALIKFSPFSASIVCLFCNKTINGDKAKAMFLKDYVVENQIDLLAITETWLDLNNQQTANIINELCPLGFAFMHIPRMKNCGGGVGLLYNKCYKIEKQDVTSFLSFEYMEVLLRTPATVLRIGVLYRPPPSTENGLTATMFFNEFPILLERLAVASGHLLLTGDFNFHVDDRTDSLASRFLDLLDSHNLIQHVSGPTHKDNHTLDLMITRACEDIIESWSTLNPHLSDHSAIHSKLSLARPRPPKVKKQYRKIRGVDPIEFRNDVMASTLFSSPACNVNDLCDQYDSELSKVVDVHAPLKTRFVTSRPSAPWYSEEIAAEKRKRRKLERRWRKSGTEADKLQYSDQCSRVRKLLKSSAY